MNVGLLFGNQWLKMLDTEYDTEYSDNQWLKMLYTEYDTKYSAANALTSKALACMVCQNIIKSVLHLGRDLVGLLMQGNKLYILESSLSN